MKARRFYIAVNVVSEENSLDLIINAQHVHLIRTLTIFLTQLF